METLARRRKRTSLKETPKEEIETQENETQMGIQKSSGAVLKYVNRELVSFSQLLLTPSL